MYAVYSPEDPNFRPFCSRTHHFWDMTQLPIWRNQLSVWLFRQYSVYVSFIYSTEGPKFCPFCSTMHRFQDTTQLPVWLIQLSVSLLWPYSAYVCCNYSLQAQIFVCFALRHTILKIQPNFLFGGTIFLFGSFGQIWFFQPCIFRVSMLTK